MSAVYLILFFGFSFVGIQCRSIVSSNQNENSETPQTSQEGIWPILTMSKDFNDSINFLTIDPQNLNKNSNFHSKELNRFIVSQGLNLEKILAEVAAKTGNINDYEEKAAQWLQQLKLMLQILPTETEIKISKPTNNRINDLAGMETILLEGDNKIISTVTNNWLDDLVDFMNEEDIDAQNSEDNERHVKQRYEDSLASFSMEHENNEEKEDTIIDSNQYGAQQLTDMLTGVQNEIGRIRKYFEKLCSKHHSMSSLAPHSDHHKRDLSANISSPKKNMNSLI